MFDSFDELLKSNLNNPESNYKLFTDSHTPSSSSKDSTSSTLDLNRIHEVTNNFSEKETKTLSDLVLNCFQNINQKYSNLPTEHRNDVMRIAQDLPQLVKDFYSPVAFLEAKTHKELKTALNTHLDTKPNNLGIS